jgi:hypothetical protein
MRVSDGDFASDAVSRGPDKSRGSPCAFNRDNGNRNATRREGFVGGRKRPVALLSCVEASAYASRGDQRHAKGRMHQWVPDRHLRLSGFDIHVVDTEGPTLGEQCAKDPVTDWWRRS